MAALVAIVFKAVRDNPQSTAARLASMFDVPLARSSQSDVVGAVYMSDVLAALVSARLVVKEGQGPTATFVVAESWSAIQQTLGISLTELALRETGSALLVRPIFGAPEPRRSKKPTAFIVMPLSKAMDPVHETIKAALEQCNLVPVRGDDAQLANQNSGIGGNIMAEVWAGMNAAKFVVADCTGRRSNVMYEVGIAHTLGKPVLLLAQTKRDIPFDVGHLRFIIYSPGEAGLAELRAKIAQRLQGARPPQDSLVER